MNDKKIISLYFISVASTLSGIHPQTIRTYEEKGLIKPYRTKGGTRRYSQEDVDKLIQIASLSQRGIKLEGIKIIYEMRDKIEEMQEKIDFLQEEISSEKSARAKKENEIHKSYKNEIVKKSNKDLRKKL
jgi:MerR family transcriptional regulator/heat shock protein HspR